MSNEDWTFVSLKEYIDQRFCDRDLAIKVAAVNVDRRLHDMNDLHRQIDTERGRFLSIESYDQQHAALEAVVDALDDKVGVRVLSIERWQSKIIGALALTTFMLPITIGIIVYLLTRHVVPLTK